VEKLEGPFTEAWQPRKELVLDPDQIEGQ